MTNEALPYPTTYDEAIKERTIYDPKRDGLEYDPKTLNWSDKDFSLPTGDTLGVFKVANTALYRIGFVAKTANGRQVPEKYAGMYTTAEFAQKDIRVFVREAWQDMEARTETQARNKLRLAAKQEDASANAAS